MRNFVTVNIVLLSALLGGCAAIPLDPQASRIITSPNQPPASCKYVGQVLGNQGNFFTGNYTSNLHLEEGAMNDLKNKASKLGANYIQLITTRAGITGSINGGESYISGSSAQTNITNVGNAYRCKPSSIGL